jgi:hypothetical protein
VVRALLEADVDANKARNNVRTPVHIAAKATRNGVIRSQVAEGNGHHAIVHALLYQDVLVSDICMANTKTVKESRLRRLDTYTFAFNKQKDKGAGKEDDDTKGKLDGEDIDTDEEEDPDADKEKDGDAGQRDAGNTEEKRGKVTKDLLD